MTVIFGTVEALFMIIYILELAFLDVFLTRCIFTILYVFFYSERGRSHTCYIDVIRTRMDTVRIILRFKTGTIRVTSENTKVKFSAVVNINLHGDCSRIRVSYISIKRCAQ